MAGECSMVAIGFTSASSGVGAAAKLEVWVYACLLSGDAPSRVVHKHGVQQINAVLLKTRHERLAQIARPLGKGGLEVGKRRDSRPCVLVRSSEEPSLVVRLCFDEDQVRMITYLKILKISSISESPGKRGLRVHISAKMQPTDHMSTPVEYCRPPRRISGDRYHNVTT